MFAPCPISARLPEKRPAPRGVLPWLILLALVAGGCNALTESSRIPQTASVISPHGTGFAEQRPHPYTWGNNLQKIFCHSGPEALELGNSLARETGAILLLTSGSSSMEPLIHGRSYVVVQYRPYDSIAVGDLLIYQGRLNAAKPDRTCMLHRAVLQDEGGWLMSGDNNRWSESWDRVTPVTYQGTVSAILEFPQ